jgi:hypothetical protein
MSICFTPSLVSLVDKHLLSRLGPLGYRRVADEKFDSFDDAIVVMERSPLRIRVLRDRGQIFVDFGSVAELTVWFDSHVVMEALSLRERTGWNSTNAKAVLADLAGFVVAYDSQLNAMFESATFKESKARLVGVREKQSVERWGSGVTGGYGRSPAG